MLGRILIIILEYILAWPQPFTCLCLHIEAPMFVSSHIEIAICVSEHKNCDVCEFTY